MKSVVQILAAMCPTVIELVLYVQQQVNGYTKYNHKTFLALGASPDEINAALDEQLTSTRSFVALGIKGGAM